MYDFRHIHAMNKAEQIRAWSVGQAIDLLRGVDAPYQAAIALSKMIEDFVTDGDVTGVVQQAVEEGVTEGRFEVKGVVEKWFTNVDLDDMFKALGWIDEKGKIDVDPEPEAYSDFTRG